jgi:catechol 2,3-dioxygenase-like lactoylglutathione lyase family enzyme
MEVSRSPNLQLIYVSDIERSTHYYSKIFNYKPIFKSPRYVVFTIDGEAQFAIWSGGTTPDNTVPRFCEIGIMLPSDKAVETLFEDWKKSDEIKFSRDLYTEVFGLTFLVEDPDGHIIRVCSVD